MIKLQEKKIRKFQNAGKFDDDLPIEDWMSNTDYWDNTFPNEEPLEIEDWMKAGDYWEKSGLFNNKNYWDRNLKVDEFTDEVGTQKIKGGGWKFRSTKKKIDENTGSEFNAMNLLGIVQPATSVMSAIMNLRALKDSKIAAQDIKAPNIHAALIPKKPIKGMDPAMRNRYLSDIANVPGPKKTSDATMNRIADQMHSETIMKAMNELGRREQKIVDDATAQYDKTTAINAQEAIKARNERSKYAADVSNKKALIEAQYTAKRAEVINRLFEEGIIKPLAKFQNQRQNKAAVRDMEGRFSMQNQIVNAQNAWKANPTTKNREIWEDLLIRQRKMEGIKI